MKMSSLLKKHQFTILLILTTVFLQVTCDSVCDLKTLIMEIKQDLEDNRILDCLREIEPLHITEETEDQRNLRLAAQWDSSCAFEASDKWLDRLMKAFGINYLVDSVGERVAKDFDNQADLCEIVRAALAKNLFEIENLNLQDLNTDDDKTMKFLNMIDCPGAGDNRLEGPRICAAVGGSYFQKDSWNIFLSSSNIKFLGSPSFHVDNRNKEAFDPTKRVNPNLLLPGAAAALKFSKDLFERKQAELVELIDKYAGDAAATLNPPDVNMDNAEINEKSDTGTIKINLKRLEMIVNQANSVYFNKSPESDFFQFPLAVMDIPTDKESIVLGFYMINYELKSDNKKATFFLKFNGAPVKETRQISVAKTAVLTGAFAIKQQVKSTRLSVDYGSKEAGSIEENKNQSFHFGAIQIPGNTVLKSVLSTSTTINKSLKWTPIPNLYLRINNTTGDNQLVVLMYTISIPIQNFNQATEFGTRLKYGNRELSDTSFISKGLSHYSAHCAYALNIEKGTQDVQLEYKYNDDSPLSTSPSDKDQVYSLTAFYLPSTSMLENCKLDIKFNLSTFGRWKNVGFKKEITIPPKREKSSVLILYHINLGVFKQKISFAVSINGKRFKNDISTSNDTDRANIQGYGVYLLKGGVYNIDLQYFLTADNSKNAMITYDPSVNGQKATDDSISLQIILLD